ncbi:MAG: MFS transporter [Chloroflexi bacterium]|nr:MFS transporter [Chloroflexota bacterium]
MAEAVEESGRPGAYRWVIFALVVLAYMGIGLPFFAPASLLPLVIEAYDIDRASAGLLMGGPSLVQAVLTVPSSILAARLGIGRTFTVGLLLLATQALVPFTAGFYQLLVVRLALGAGAAIVMPLAGALLHRWFSRGPMPLLTGLSFTSIAIGNGLGLLTAVPLAEMVGWKVSLGVYGLLAVVVLLLWMALGQGKEERATAPSIPFGDIFQVIRDPKTLFIGLAIVGPWGASTALISWLPSFYYEVRQVSLGEAGTRVSMALLATIPVTFVASVLVTRVGLRKPFMIVPGLVMGLSGLGTFLLAAPSAAFVSFLVFYSCNRLSTPAVLAVPSELPGMTSERVGVVWGVAFAMGASFAFVSPPLIGLIRDLTGSFIPGLAFGALIAFSLALAGLLLPETGPRARRKMALAKS